MSKSLFAFRAPAIFCAFAVLACVLVSKPFTAMGVCDDGPYILMARTFAQTGHLIYNGWAVPMMLAQIYFAAPFIKLFGFSPTSVRMSTLVLAAVTAFVFQRTLARAGASERNATLGTLAVVISPLYLMLSATFMSDIAGLFAVTLCLYGCVRALQASADRSAIAWICFAAFSCAVFGTSRQIAWLGTLVMVPSTLWLLRSRRQVLFSGAAATALAFLFILGCLFWLRHQPYAVPMPEVTKPFPDRSTLEQLSYIILEIPLLVLPVAAVFIRGIFRSRPYLRYSLLAVLVAYVAIAFHLRYSPDPIIELEPTAGHIAAWLNVYGVLSTVPGTPVLLRTIHLIFLTILCIGGLLGVIAVALQARGEKSSSLPPTDVLSWKQLGILLLPFYVAYLIALVGAAGTGSTHVIFDRYAIDLLGPTSIVLVRLYQERLQPALPLATVLLVILTAGYGIIVTHNTFALNRARVDLGNELHARGVPFTAIDGAWDYNLDTELQNSDHLNDPRIRVPVNSYVRPLPTPRGFCRAYWAERTPHIHAVYGVSFRPDRCYGTAPFPPVQYRPWPFNTPINLYAVRYAPPTQSSPWLYHQSAQVRTEGVPGP